MIHFFYDLCYMLPLNLVVILSFLTYRGRQENGLSGCIIGTLVILFALALRHTGKKERILISGVVTAALAGLFWVLGKEKREYVYEQLDFLLFIFCVAVAAMIVGRLAQEYLWLMLVVALALLGNMFYLMINRIHIAKVAVAGSFLTIMIYLVTVIQCRWKKSGYTEIKKHVSLITPMLFLVFLLVCFTPAPEKTFDWSPIKNIWEKTVVGCKRLTGILVGMHDEYEYKYSGFSEDVSLDGNVNPSDREVMLLTNYEKSLDCLYLGGVAFEDFVTNGWETDLTEEGRYRQFDYIETRTAIRKYDPENESDYIQKATFRVENRLLHTKHVFLPNKADLDSGITTLPKYMETETSILTKSGLRYGDTYSLPWYRLNYENPDLANLMDHAEPIEEAQWQETLKKAEVYEPEALSYEKYQDYRNDIYEKYGTTVGLSPEVSTLVEQITSGVEGKYERLQVLADYLQTMEYHTAPGIIPAEVTNASEYLDYFLLESGQGYCVHYATAFVLLARECGYPARFVQGYYVKLNRNAKEHLVAESRAHVWAEVYFDNFGWVVFETTPGYTLSNGWNVEKTNNPVTVQKQPASQPLEDETEEEVISEELPEETEKKEIRISYVVVPVFLAAFYGILFLLVSRLITKYKYGRMSHDEKVRFLLQRNLKILKRLGYPLSATETIEEYRHRVETGFPDAIHSLGFLGLFEKLLYADYEAEKEDVVLMEQDYRLLWELYQERFFCPDHRFLT